MDNFWRLYRDVRAIEKNGFSVILHDGFYELIAPRELQEKFRLADNCIIYSTDSIESLIGFYNGLMLTLQTQQWGK